MTKLAETILPGDFIREELDERRWTQADLAEIMGRPVETISRIVTGKLAITPETARGLGAAFGTSADLWLNLESAYQLSQVDDNESVARRARLYDIAPIKDMVKRGWIESSSSVEVMEKQIVEFFDLRDINDKPAIKAAARKSTAVTNAAQMAWYFYTKRLASSMDVGTYSKAKLNAAISKLKQCATHPLETRHVPKILADAGVRFVVVKYLPKSKIDGAAFWLDAARKKRPVIAMSLRYDRIDYFWHTLGHEVAHILYRDAVSLDSDIVGRATDDEPDKPDYEQRADEFALTLIVPREEIEDFIVRVRPLYAKKSIIGFANRIGVHPGIVVGQLQYRQEIGYGHSREMLAKVRHIIAVASCEDGWQDVRRT